MSTTRKYDKELFLKALSATAEHRGSKERLLEIKSIMEAIGSDKELKQTWLKYQKKFIYAKDISFEDTITALHKLILGE